MNGERFDPLKIVQAFNHRGVEYVVIGGYAGELHAAAVPPTRDIDFTPRATQENLRRLSQVLTDLDARIRTEGIPEGLPFSHDAESLANVGMWNLTCRFGEFDISFKPSGTDGYEDLVRTALRVDVRGEQMPVASLADIIRSKEAAGRPKDFTALPALQERLIAQQGTCSRNRQQPWLGGQRNARSATRTARGLVGHSATSQPRKARPTDGALSRASCAHLSSPAPHSADSPPNQFPTSHRRRIVRSGILARTSYARQCVREGARPGTQLLADDSREGAGLIKGRPRLGRWDASPARSAAAASSVSVLVSFVVVRLGSATAADGLVEHEADVDDHP